MKNFKNLVIVALFFATAAVFGQTKLTGKVVDETNEPLPGASVMVKGTTNGTSTDFDGNFTLTANSNSGTIVISFVGYSKKEVTFSSAKNNLGTIQLLEDGNVLNEIVITATSFAIDRKTPVAVSTVKAAEIERKLGTQEFPEILKSTPGVYATKTGGGYGDSRINLRGFSSQNVGVLINGVPVNDMENGAVYWSNWSGLSDVTSAMQVQRGLGASKVAVPSIGGTINIVTNSTDAIKGGNITTSTANNGYQKYGFKLSTGLMDNGFAVTVSAAKVSGDGYVNGTPFDGVNYFLNVSNQISDTQKLSFTVFGAKQTHGQRYNTRTISQYRDTEQGGQQFNPDWGYRNGKVENISYNFYHKPQMSLNYDWTISDKTFLTTAVYASFGSGGGRRQQGGKFTDNNYRLGGVDQPIDFDRIVQENKDRGALGADNFFAASKNSHKWYGILSTLKTNLSEKLVFSGGLDARSYVGSHWYEVTDLMGGQFYINPDDKDNTYNQALKVGDRFSKDYDGFVKRYGVFGQLEYSPNDNLSIFFSSAMSNTSYSKTDYMKYAPTDPKRNSETSNFFGYSFKSGANYNINEHSNIFGNIGYFSKAPFLTGDVFISSSSTELNPDAKNEKIFSMELGYGYRSSKFSANVNVYSTSWIDKSLTGRVQDPTPTNPTVPEFLEYSLPGLDALHQGLEFDFRYKFGEKLSMTGMASLGNWKWKSDVTGTIFDQGGAIVNTVDVYANGLKVSDAAQTTYALGLDYKVLEKTSLFLDYNYAGDIYAKFDITRRDEPTDRADSWKMPAYHLFDFGFSHGFKIGDFDATFSGKMNNIFNVEYISDAFDVREEVSPKVFVHNSENAGVYYGAGRTFSLGLKVKF